MAAAIATPAAAIAARVRKRVSVMVFPFWVRRSGYVEIGWRAWRLHRRGISSLHVEPPFWRDSTVQPRSFGCHPRPTYLLGARVALPAIRSARQVNYSMPGGDYAYDT
ncbi:hypothetical protein MBRA_19350 [Mycobacterium branderi]|uniref:Secreted protein n=1 Tax=Mycobacterium branderi TaxID=43348 RepID=A0ABM7KLE9_9MYCO|nr:hypothetical protein MBRA_19350 [Mycobacterium branderi]